MKPERNLLHFLPLACLFICQGAKASPSIPVSPTSGDKENHSSGFAADSSLGLAMLGNWVRPQEVKLTGGSTLWDAAMAAGGPIQGSPGMIQVMRDNVLVLQVNLGHEASRKATLAGLGLRPGDVVFHGFPAAPPSRWARIQTGLNVAMQILAITSSLLSTYLTYNILHDQGKI